MFRYCGTLIRALLSGPLLFFNSKTSLKNPSIETRINDQPNNLENVKPFFIFNQMEQTEK